MLGLSCTPLLATAIAADVLVGQAASDGRGDIGEGVGLIFCI